MDEGKARKKLDIFISEEKSKQLMGIREAVGKIKDKTEIKPVPGSAGKGYLVAIEFITNTLADLVRFYVELHYLDLSFDGNLTLDDMFWTLNGGIRVLATAELKLIQSTLSAEKNDMKSLAKSVKGNLFDWKALPTDICHLVHLLENEYTPNMWLPVYNHPGLLNQAEKLVQFGLLYMSYRYVEAIDPVKAARIFGNMPYCDIDIDHWKYKALDNIYLEGILFHTQETTHPASRNYVQNPNLRKKGNRKYRPPNTLTPLIASRIQRAMSLDPNLAQNAGMHQSLKSHVQTINTSNVPYIPLDPAGDRKLLIQFVLDDIGQYENKGDAMLKGVRNSCQHIPDAFLVLAAQAAGAVAAPAPAQAAAAVQGAQAPVAAQALAQAAAAVHGTQAPVAAQAPAAVPQYHEVETIFGEVYPRALCDFFMAMVSEKEVAYLKDVQKYLPYFSQ